MTQLKMTYRDFIMLFVIAVSGTSVVLMNIYLPGFVI